MLKLEFNFRDIFRAPRLAFSLQRMWIQLVGMTVGFVGYLIFSYLAFIAAGFKFGVAWGQYGLLPCLFATGEAYPWYAWALAGLGSLLFFIAYLVTNTAVSRAVYMVSKGNNFYTWREAYAFSFRKIASIVLTPVSLIILIGFMILGALVLGLLGKIPFVGEIGVSLFTIVWFAAALLLFFFAVVVFVSILLVPSIIATTDEDAFEAVFQSFSVTWSQPWRLVFYEALTTVLAFFAMGVFAFAAKESVMIMNKLFGSFMGGDYINFANNGQALVQSWTLMGSQLVAALYGDYTTLVFFSREFIMIPVDGLSTSVVISSYLYALSLLFIAGWVLSYGISTFTVGNTLLFTVIKKMKDDENLLERKDKEEEEEEESTEETDTESTETPTPEDNAPEESESDSDDKQSE